MLQPRQAELSATAITAITPLAAGTLPAMFSLTTIRPCVRTSRTARSMSPTISDPASTSAFIRGSLAHARTASASGCSPTRGIVSTEMRSPRMLWRSASEIADGDLPDLRASAHDDDALSENRPKCFDLGDAACRFMH